MFVGVVAPATGSKRIGAGSLAGIAARSTTCNRAIEKLAIEQAARRRDPLAAFFLRPERGAPLA